MSLAYGWDSADVPGWCMTEITAGDATLAWTVAEQVRTVSELLALARALASGEGRLEGSAG